MGFLSSLLGESKEQKALREAFGHIRRIIEDDEYQLSMLHPEMKKLIEASPGYDRNPNGTGAFGFSVTNAIPVNGPIGQIAYLSKLETMRGERLLFHRIGAVGTIDVYEAVTFSGSEWFVFFLDMYHPRRSRAAPDGFRFAKEPAQFSGFHTYCREFPYDFVDQKQSLPDGGLRLAYIPISAVVERIDSGAYSRPLPHKAKLDLLRSTLTSCDG